MSAHDLPRAVAALVGHDGPPDPALRDLGVTMEALADVARGRPLSPAAQALLDVARDRPPPTREECLRAAEVLRRVSEAFTIPTRSESDETP